MTEIYGTWKAAGYIDKEGNKTNKKPPIKFTFCERGQGKMKLFFIGSTFTWENHEDTVTVHGANGNMDFTLEDDQLIMKSGGSTCIFKKVA